MNAMSSRPVDSEQDHPFLRKSFSRGDVLRRYLFQIVWRLLCRTSPVPLHRWRVGVLRLFGAKMGRFNTVYPTAVIFAPWLLETEDFVTIGPAVEVYNPGGVRLGHHTILSQGSYLCGATHDYQTFDFTYIKKPITSDPYAWVCARAIVLPGVHLGTGSVLGAAAVTSRSLEPWTVYAGNPSKPVGKRNEFPID